MEETSIKFSGDFAGTYGTAIKASFETALALESKLPNWVLELEGMSGRVYRRFINSLVASIDDPRYLEIGSWAGSTSCSAMFGNTVKITCIDNWSEFEGPKGIFLRSTNDARSDGVDFQFIENDFRAIDYSDIGRFNIYLFDGPHAYADQFDGIVMAQAALENSYVQIVDDWNWPYVRNGSIDAMRKAYLQEICSIVIRTTQDDSHPVTATRQNSAWHNGYYIGVLTRH